MERRRAKGYAQEGAEQLTNQVQSLLGNAPSELRWAWQQAVESTSFALLANGESVTSDKDSNTATKTTSAKSKGKHRADNGLPNAKSARLTLGQDADEEAQVIGSTQELATAKSRTRSLSCELALLAQLLIVRIHYPIPSKLDVMEPSTPVSSALVDASKAILRIAMLMKPAGPPLSLRSGSPTLLAMYPLDQLVFDATVLCSRHCFGGTIVKTKDDKAGVQKKDPGSDELVQTMGFGLTSLEEAYGISKGVGQASTSSNTAVYSTTPLSVKTKIVASLRKQWELRNSSITSTSTRKRPRSTMEGKPVASPVEQEKKTSGSTTQVTRLPGSSTETKEPPPSNANDQPKANSPGAAAPAHPSTQTPSPTPVATDSDAAVTSTPAAPRFAMVQDAVAVAEKKKVRTASSGNRDRAQVTIRSRVAKDGSAGPAGKRKHDPKSQTPSQPLMTTAARVLKEDGRLGYENESQAPVRLFLPSMHM